MHTKARPTIAHVAGGWIHASVASTRLRFTRQLFERSCVKKSQQAAGDLAPNEALRMLEQQWDEFFHGRDHWAKCITGAIHIPGGLMSAPRELNAYRIPQELRPGCQHQLGCRCDPPFWLRPSTSAEEAIADRIYGAQGEGGDDTVE